MTQCADQYYVTMGLNMLLHLACLVIACLVIVCKEAVSQKNDGDTCVDQYTNTVGVCRSSENCLTAKADYEKNGIRPTFCEYSAFGDNLVCCRDGTTILQTAKPRTADPRPIWSSPNDNRRVSEKKCDAYSRSVVSRVDVSILSTSAGGGQSQLAARCRYSGLELIVGGEDATRGEFPHMYSRSVVSRVDVSILSTSSGGGQSQLAARCRYSGVELIVGGEDASRGEFPHMAAIGWVNYDDGYDFNCGGSLISTRFVLTAGHCTRDPRARDPVPALVRLGDQNIDNRVDDGAEPVDVPIRNIHVHPSYAPPSKYDDIALLELATDVKFEDSIRPACLWPQAGLGGHEKAVATGWGVYDTVTRKTSKELQKVSLTLLENEYCVPLIDTNRHWQGFRDTQMCAGELRGGKDTCQGDSGSPLQTTSKDNPCIFYVMGVTSFGKQCGKSGTPAVYTRVSSYLDWIEGVVWPGES